MFKYIKISWNIIMFIFIPNWVFSNTGIELSFDKCIHIYKNRHLLDWWTLVFEDHWFALVCIFSLCLNVLIFNWSVPIISWIKNTGR